MYLYRTFVGRYGVACGTIATVLKKIKNISLTGMYERKSGADMFR